MTIQLVDLSNIVSIVLGSMAGVLAFFQIVRTLFLDRLTKGRLDATQQNTLYHVLVWLIIAGLIVLQAWLHGYTFNPVLVVSALVAAWPIQQGVNIIFNAVQKPPTVAYQYAEIPAGVGSDVNNATADEPAPAPTA